MFPNRIALNTCVSDLRRQEIADITGFSTASVAMRLKRTKEKLIGYSFIIPSAVLICVIHYAKIHASLFWWVLTSCFLIAIIIFVLYFFRLYDKNISTIQQNLDELQELKEE